jgi:CRISPR-associated protein Cas1
VCFGNIMVSPAAMHRCAELGISLVFLGWNGRFKARLEGPVNGNVLLRQAQYLGYQNPDFCLEVAKAFVGGKLRNSRYVLLRGARDSTVQDDQQSLRTAASELARTSKALVEASTLDQLRGFEGDAAKRYFEAFNVLVKPDCRTDFRLNGRSRRPPMDRLNTLLSFLYALLMNDCRTAIESVGLDPQVGFLHALRPGRAALALDLMEEFRSILADRLALTLVNRLQIQADDFIEEPTGAFRFKDNARKAVVVAYQERKKELLSHALLTEKLPFGLVPQIQARLLARTLRNDVPCYVPFSLK